MNAGETPAIRVAPPELPGMIGRRYPTQRSLGAARRGPSVGLGYCWGQCLRHF